MNSDEFVLVNEEDFKPDKPDAQASITKTLYMIYKIRTIMVQIYNVSGFLYIMFYLYNNPLTNSVISAIGYGPFMIIYITILKIRGFL